MDFIPKFTCFFWNQFRKLHDKFGIWRLEIQFTFPGTDHFQTLIHPLTNPLQVVRTPFQFFFKFGLTALHIMAVGVADQVSDVIVLG